MTEGPEQERVLVVLVSSATGVLLPVYFSHPADQESKPPTVCKDGQSHCDVTRWFVKAGSVALVAAFTLGSIWRNLPVQFDTVQFHIWMCGRCREVGSD